MKTELEIAKLNIKVMIIGICYEHKTTCERWLEFLKRDNKQNCSFCNKPNWLDSRCSFYNQIKDLKQTIALYKENGI